MRRLVWRKLDLPSLRSLLPNCLNRLITRENGNPKPRWRKPSFGFRMSNDDVVDADRDVAH